jgi:hypothetical protein
MINNKNPKEGKEDGNKMIGPQEQAILKVLGASWSSWTKPSYPPSGVHKPAELRLPRQNVSEICSPYQVWIHFSIFLSRISTSSSASASASKS